MSRLAIAACVVLSLGCGLALVQEWRAGDLAIEQADEVMTVRPIVDPPAAPMPAAPAPVQAEQREVWLQDSLARPLFEPDRRPPRSDEPAATATPALPRLAGVLVSASGRQAIFAGADGKPVVVGEGEKISGYLVEAIAAGEVRIAGAEGPRLLHPSFDPNFRPPVVAAVPVPQPVVNGGRFVGVPQGNGDGGPVLLNQPTLLSRTGLAPAPSGNP